MHWLVKKILAVLCCEEYVELHGWGDLRWASIGSWCCPRGTLALKIVEKYKHVTKSYNANDICSTKYVNCVIVERQSTKVCR